MYFVFVAVDTHWPVLEAFIPNPLRPPCLAAQNDASPYVEKAIARCRLVHTAIHRSSAKSSAASVSGVHEPGSGSHVPLAGSSPTRSRSASASGKLSVAGEGSGVAGSSALHEQPPDFTEVPAIAQGLAWRGVVDAALLALLRGFGRVTRCSTEGRALMSMDLQVGP